MTPVTESCYLGANQMYMDTSRHRAQTEVSRSSIENQATLMSHTNTDACKQIFHVNTYMEKL